jgi:hypothetical protein
MASQVIAPESSSTLSWTLMAFGLKASMLHSKTMLATVRAIRLAGADPVPEIWRQSSTTWPPKILTTWPGSSRRERSFNSLTRVQMAAARAHFLELVDHCCKGFRARGLHSKILFDRLPKRKGHAIEDGFATLFEVVKIVAAWWKGSSIWLEASVTGLILAGVALPAPACQKVGLRVHLSIVDMEDCAPSTLFHVGSK